MVTWNTKKNRKWQRGGIPFPTKDTSVCAEIKRIMSVLFVGSTTYDAALASAAVLTLAATACDYRKI